MSVNSNKINRAPVFFIGHGSPMNAIAKSDFTESLRTLGLSMPRPKAIVVISAHWSTDVSALSTFNSGELLYDMYGFPDALYQVKYPAPNADFLFPDLQKLLPDLALQERKLDHGVWSVLLHLFPKADIPITQLSINSSLSMQEHFELANAIKSIRQEGVMIIGSGNITHNLRDINMHREAAVSPWAEEFDEFVKDATLRKDYKALIDFEKIQRHAKHAHPTTEHYIPLLYVAGSAYEDDKSEFIYEGFEHGNLSLRNWLLR